MKSRTIRFLCRQLLTPEFWLLVLIAVLLYYLFQWQRRLKNLIFESAGEFFKEVAKCSLA
jgi:hypothetical protein